MREPKRQSRCPALQIKKKYSFLDKGNKNDYCVTQLINLICLGGSMENIKIENSFLQTFMARRLSSYVEPERAGTPRGEPIGFSAQKYAAVLYCLTNRPLKEIAKEIKVSYGLLRKWRTEDKFWDVFDETVTEFADTVINHLKKRADKQKELRDDYFSKSVDEMIKMYPMFLNWDEFLDIKLYFQGLVLFLFGKAKRHLEALVDEDDLDSLSFWYQLKGFINCLTTYTSESVEEYNKEFGDVIDTENKKMQEISYLACLNLLRKEKLSEEDRKMLIYVMHDQAGRYNYVKMDF